MTDDVPSAATEALSAHDAIEADESAYRVTTTAFEGTVTASEGEDAADGPEWTVSVTVPSLEAATSDPVGEAVADGWFETFARRLEDAPMATRADLELASCSVERQGLDVVVTFTYHWGDPDRAVAIAKTLVEYVEGTYVEGVVPGYTYVSPVADLLSTAETGGDAQRGGTPL